MRKVTDYIAAHKEEHLAAEIEILIAGFKEDIRPPNEEELDLMRVLTTKHRNALFSSEKVAGIVESEPSMVEMLYAYSASPESKRPGVRASRSSS